MTLSKYQLVWWGLFDREHWSIKLYSDLGLMSILYDWCLFIGPLEIRKRRTKPVEYKEVWEYKKS